MKVPNGLWWFNHFWKIRRKEKQFSEHFPDIKLGFNHPPSELMMVPYMMGRHLHNEITIDFLQDIIASDPSADISLVRQESS